MKNILQDKENIKNYLTSLKSTEKGNDGYYLKGCTLLSLLNVCRTALHYIDNNPSDKSIGVVDVMYSLELADDLIPMSEFELLDSIKDEVLNKD